MDTRTLKYAGHTTVWNAEGQPEDHAEIRDENDQTVAFVVEQNTDLELVKRWNAHPDLLAALESIREWSNSRDGSAETDEAALTEINGIAMRAIEATQQTA